MGLWNLNNFGLDPNKLAENLKNGSLYKFLNRNITRKNISRYLKKEENGNTRIEEMVKKFSSDNRTFFERITRDKETIIPYIIFEHICRLFNIEKEKLSTVLNNAVIRRAILNIAETIVKYGVTTPMVFSQPLMLVWNITGKCDLRCKHCYQDAGVLSKGLPEELTREEKIKVMEEIIKSNIPTFAFAGGEPLIDSTFWELAEIGKKGGLYMSINTNGTLITEEVAEKLKDIGFAYYGVSLDGSSAEVHDNFRGVKGCFEKTLKGIKNLIKVGEGNKVCISYTVARENSIIKNEIPEMIKLRDELGIRKIVLYNYIPCGRGDFKNDLTAQEREKLFKLFYYDLQSGKESLLTTAPQFGRYCKQMYEDGKGNVSVIGHFASGNMEKLKNLVELIGGCGAGRAYIALQPDGKITPCVFMPTLIAGNIKKDGEIKIDNLIDVWDKAEIINKLRMRRSYSENYGCKGKYKSVCGGCAARAYAYFGDVLAPDPGCILNQKFNNISIEKEVVSQN